MLTADALRAAGACGVACGFVGACGASTQASANAAAGMRALVRPENMNNLRRAEQRKMAEPRWQDQPFAGLGISLLRLRSLLRKVMCARPRHDVDAKADSTTRTIWPCRTRRPSRVCVAHCSHGTALSPSNR